MDRFRFLVDENLPKYFRFFNSPNFTFVKDILSSKSDTEIWDFALNNGYVILSRDFDFYHKSIFSKNRPKVVHFRLKNCGLKALNSYFDRHWDQIVVSLIEHDLILASTSGLEFPL